MLWLILALVAVSFAISFPLTVTLVRAGRRVGALDSAGAHGHVKTLRGVPNIGGIAIFAAVALPLLVGVAWIAAGDPGGLLDRLAPRLAPHLGGERMASSLRTATAMLAGLTVLHVLGVVDDRRSLGPWLKLIVQAGVALVLAVWFDVRLLELLGPGPSIALTVVWIIAVTNAINFMDNMDGLAGGVSLIAAGFFLAACLLNAQWFIAATLALTIGALAGFLPFNLPPARIFMGDGGSLVVGFLLAVLTARTTFVHPGLGGGWYGVFMPLIVLAIPLYDFATVTAIRLRQGRSPFVGDQQHFSHRLVQRGLSRRGAVAVIWAATAVTGISGIALGSLEDWQAILVAIQTVLVLLMLGVLEHASRHAVRREGDA